MFSVLRCIRAQWQKRNFLDACFPRDFFFQGFLGLLRVCSLSSAALARLIALRGLTNG
ncbi:hypothetical protein COCCADRAFT_107812 [Bipolaris zeicola 26-R-13]|uniref:Uncharacterized protein n=1 Tax=Cochliobolus carbonum (strain 26-R-13) TaxID=930089 RepID=W6XNN6_COCC2|nr:uncharacterized protein COCCADRAFT_107812 [Bipolaris zeicola 26-R-13]EUC28947.1 hypothetical protein COCCADRAFT_107812 [Bipolaris zeicola 26-R-13]